MLLDVGSMRGVSPDVPLTRGPGQINLSGGVHLILIREFRQCSLKFDLWSNGTTKVPCEDLGISVAKGCWDDPAYPSFLTEFYELELNRVTWFAICNPLSLKFSRWLWYIIRSREEGVSRWRESPDCWAFCVGTNFSNSSLISILALSGNSYGVKSSSYTHGY